MALILIGGAIFFFLRRKRVPPSAQVDLNAGPEQFASYAPYSQYTQYGEKPGESSMPLNQSEPSPKLYVSALNPLRYRLPTADLSVFRIPTTRPLSPQLAMRTRAPVTPVPTRFDRPLTIRLLPTASLVTSNPASNKRLTVASRSCDVIDWEVLLLISGTLTIWS